MTASMTGFATATGTGLGWRWEWEIRSVNGKGLDLRLRVPDWISGLEQALRGRVRAAAQRGSITLSLRLVHDAPEAGGIDPRAVETALEQIAAVERIAAASGRDLLAVRATDILAMRPAAGGPDAAAVDALRQMLVADAEARLMPAFERNRAAEGRALDAILIARLDEIGDLLSRAAAAAEARRAGQGDMLRAAIDRLGAEVHVDPDRLAQELALLWVKQDVTEEIDRLAAHLGAARDILAGPGPKGRKLDFLMQEFNREANTLCAKSQDPELTARGLDLKSVIDQLREQVQNVE